MDPFYFLYYISLFALPIVLYVLFSKRKTSCQYSEPEWYHYLKICCAIPYVKRFQEDQAQELQNVSDEEQEKPKGNLKEYEADNQVIYGADAKGNYFCLKVTLRCSMHVEVSILYGDNEGRMYVLPNEPQVLVCSIASRQWKAAGLNIEILQPFQRMRITYNGLMRNIITKETNITGTVEHVQFHFLWNAATAPLHYPQDVNVNLLIEAIGKEPWRDGEWVNMLGSDHGYDQFGALQGFFKAKNEDHFIYMPSWRRRRVGPSEAMSLERDLFVFGVVEDGSTFCVGAKSIRMGCTQFPYGCLITSGGELHSISSNDLSLEYLADDGEVPRAFSLHFRANGRTYKCIAHVNRSKVFTSHNNERKGWLMKIVPAECDLNYEQANAIITFWYRNSGNAFDFPTSLLKSKASDNPEELLLVKLYSEECLDHSLTGGKGNSLGMLSYCLKSNKFEVPPGFVITTMAFRRQLRENPQLSRAIKYLEDICYGKIEGDIEATCKTTMDTIAGTPISKEISDLITEEVNDLKSRSPEEIWRWAVRSSGLDEDSDETSAAGQNFTALGCGENEILTAVSTCWGSLFSFQSVQYRRRHGMTVYSEMGVVVQKMVPAESAGVLFTCHPTTGNPGQMIITSNYGLGQSVVSASADPDTIILARNHLDKVRISHFEIGSKKTKIILGEDQKGITGTKEINTQEYLANKLSISQEQALRLGRIAVLLEKKFGNPRDIEWAFSNDTLYLLQSRPITTLNAWTDWELQHEFDTPILSENSVYTRANVGEVCKGAMTVLSQRVVMKIMDSEMQREAYEKTPNPYSQGPMVHSSHTVFLDMLNFMYDSVSGKLDMQTRMIDLAVFGHLVFNEQLHEIALNRHGAVKGLKAFKRGLKLFVQAMNTEKILEKVLRLNNRWEIRFKSSDQPSKMLEKIENNFDKLGELLRYHIYTSRSSLIFQMIAMIVLTEDSKEFKEEHFSDIALLLSTNSAVESAEIPVILESIATNIRDANKAGEFVKIDPVDGEKWLEENCPNTKKLFDEFLTNHGHRLFREFEFKERTWKMDPSPVISMIQSNCLAATTTKKATGLNVDETIAKLVTPKRKLTKYILKFLVRKCRKSVAAREKTKSELIKGVHRFRLAYLELSKQMRLSGQLPEEELVFHLTHEELKSLAGGKSPELVSKATRRKRLYEKWDKFQFPELNYGIPVPEPDENDLIETTDDASGIKLTGTPVYQGNVIGKACVIIDIKDAKQIRSGDILITQSTDIAWSPYFPMLSGVVTELGGLISHGAVVAREYGLPCIVGVQKATKYFKTGDKVKINGKLGLLELIK